MSCTLAPYRRSPLSPQANWPTALGQAAADLDDAEHAYEAARLTLEPAAILVAWNRRARALVAHEAARLASLTTDELAQEDDDRQGAGYHATTHL